MNQNWLGCKGRSKTRCRIRAAVAFMIIIGALIAAEAIAAVPPNDKLLEPRVSFVGRGPVVPISDDPFIPISVVNIQK